MAVPTPDELYDFFDQLMDRAGNPHAIFEWEYLNTSAFRHFSSKVAPVDRVMKELVDEGRLVKVDVSNGGYVYLDRTEFTGSMFSLYFQYYGGMRYGSGNWGVVTHERSKGHENVWREGVRYLYTTGPRYEAMLADFLKAKEEYDEAKRQEKADEASRIKDALNAVAPDAEQLLKRLDKVIPGIEKRVRSRSFADKEVLYLSLDLRDSKEIGPFLSILRRGLPDVPRETSESP